VEEPPLLLSAALFNEPPWPTPPAPPPAPARGRSGNDSASSLADEWSTTTISLATNNEFKEDVDEV